MNWRRLNGQRIEEPLLTAVENTIIRETEAGFKLKICIGTDSQVVGEEVHFATVIVFLREKRGGFWHKQRWVEVRTIAPPTTAGCH